MTREFFCSFFTCSVFDSVKDTLFPLRFSSEIRIKNVYTIFLGILIWLKLGQKIPLLSQSCNGEIMSELIWHNQENLILQFQAGEEGFLQDPVCPSVPLNTEIFMLSLSCQPVLIYLKSLNFISNS